MMTWKANITKTLKNDDLLYIFTKFSFLLIKESVNIYHVSEFFNAVKLFWSKIATKSEKKKNLILNKK